MTLDEFLATCPALPIQDSRHEFCSQREAVSDAFR